MLKYYEGDVDDLIIDCLSLNIELMGFEFDMDNKIYSHKNCCFKKCLKVNNSALNTINLNFPFFTFLKILNFR